MAEATKHSTLFRSPHDGEMPIDSLMQRGEIYVATGTVENAADDSSGSEYHLIDLPSHSLIDEGTKFGVSGDGFAQIRIGTRTDPGALIDVAKSAGAIVQPVTFGDEFHGKRVWEILGLPKDPGGVIGIWKHAAANATAAGRTDFVVKYICN